VANAGPCKPRAGQHQGPCMHPVRTLVTTASSRAANPVREAFADGPTVTLSAMIACASPPSPRQTRTSNGTQQHAAEQGDMPAVHPTCLKKSSRRCHSSHLSTPSPTVEPLFDYCTAAHCAVWTSFSFFPSQQEPAMAAPAVA
jgi:hypothetical protein